jgi:hypothetical protein
LFHQQVCLCIVHRSINKKEGKWEVYKRGEDDLGEEKSKSGKSVEEVKEK